MEIEALALFVDVAEAGSFADAARRRNIDPSQVSRTIAALEKNLQIRLFKRSTRKLSLTEAGERYLARIVPVLEEMNFAAEEARELTQRPSGLIRMTASTAFGQVCLLPILPAFYEAYPNIEIELQLSDSNIDLFSEDIDLACRLAPSFQSDLIGVKLFDTCYRVCASPSYLKKSKPITQPQDLKEHKNIVLALAHYRSRWLFKDAENQLSEVKVQSRFAVSNALALRECLLKGMGPGLAADWLIDRDIASGDLVDLFLQLRVTATDFNTGAWLLYPSRHYMPLKTRVMIDFLKKHLTHWRGNKLP